MAELIVAALQPLKVPIDSVQPDPQNVRQHPEPNRKAISKSLQGFQQRKPIVVNKRTMTIEAGNGLWQEMKALGATEIAVVFVEDTDEQAKAFGIMDNRSAEMATWDPQGLKELLQELNTGDCDMDLTGFDSKALEELMTQFDVENEQDILSSKKEELDGMGAVFDLRADVKFDGAGAFDIPRLLPDKALDMEAPVSWAGPQASIKSDFYLYNYGTDSTLNLDFTHTVISFYTDDARFERLWWHTKEVATRLLNKRVRGMVSPNFSTYYSWPRALRLYNVFRSRWVARYMQEAGVSVMCDISGAVADMEWLFDGIPEGFPLCVQVHRAVGTEEEQREKNLVIAAAIERIKPCRLWVYGTRGKEAAYPALADARCEWIIPRQVYLAERKKQLMEQDRQRAE